MKENSVTSVKNKKQVSAKRKRKVWYYVLALLFLIVFLLYNYKLKIVNYEVTSSNIASEITIVLITDLHACRYGKEQSVLIDAIKDAEPDMVLLAGDIFDEEHDYTNAEIVLEYIGKTYPSYFVTGNHEFWCENIDYIRSIVAEYNINLLAGTYIEVSIKGTNLNICGVDDPDVELYEKEKSFEQELSEVSAAMDNGNYSILLSHQPGYARWYFNYGFDLTVSGHAHGGQWRIPGVMNGLFTPSEGFFPKYAGGRYDSGNQTLIVSRGLARESTLIPRIFNRPELVVIKLKP